MAWSRFTYPAPTRLAYTTRTTTYSVASTTLAGAANIFSSNLTFTADGISAYRIAFFCQSAYHQTASNTCVYVHLVNSSGTSLGVIGNAGRGDGTAVGHNDVYSEIYYTPAAGSTTINVRAFAPTNLSAGNNNMDADTNAPIWLGVFAPDAVT